jgi:hypothetical protein
MNRVFLVILFLIGSSVHSSAQNKICDFKDGQMHTAYIFSSSTYYNMVELFGDTVPLLMIDLQYIKSELQKNKIDKLVSEGKLHNSCFIFPESDSKKTRRFCNEEDYQTAAPDQKFFNSSDN